MDKRIVMNKKIKIYGLLAVILFLSEYSFASEHTKKKEAPKTRFQRFKKYARKKSKNVRKKFREKKHQFNAFITKDITLKNQLNAAYHLLPELLWTTKWKNELAKEDITEQKYTVFDLIAYGPENYHLVSDWFKNASNATKEAQRLYYFVKKELNGISNLFDEAEITFVKMPALNSIEKKNSFLSLMQKALAIETLLKKTSDPTNMQEPYAYFFGKMAEFFQALSNRAAKGDAEMILEVPTGKKKPFVPEFKNWVESLLVKDTAGKEYFVLDIIKFGEKYYPVAIKALRKAANETRFLKIKQTLSLAAEALTDLQPATFEPIENIESLTMAKDMFFELASNPTLSANFQSLFRNFALTFSEIIGRRETGLTLTFFTPTPAPKFAD